MAESIFFHGGKVFEHGGTSALFNHFGDRTAKIHIDKIGTPLFDKLRGPSHFLWGFSKKLNAHGTLIFVKSHQGFGSFGSMG
jgi:hypothetical protein